MLQQNRNYEPFSNELTAEIRSCFFYADADPIAGERIFFENGGGSLTLKVVVERSAELAALPDSAAGRSNLGSQHLARTIDEGREALRILFGSDRGQVVAGLTGTECLFRIIGNVLRRRRPGNVVSSDLEHTASYDAARYWAEETGRDWRSVSVRPESGDVTAEDYARAVSHETVLATVVHTSHVTGKRLEIPAIAKAIRARAPECFIIVDGIQHAPHGLMSVADYDVDAYVFAPYKAFARRGGAFAWLSDRLAVLPHDKMEETPPESWALGGPDATMYGAQLEVHGYLVWLGGHFTNASDERARIAAAMNAIGRQEAGLVRLMINGRQGVPGLKNLAGVHVIGGHDMAGREGPVSFTVSGRSSADVVTALAERGIRVHERDDARASSARHILRSLGLKDCVRVTVGHFNTEAEVETFLRTLPEVIRT